MYRSEEAWGVSKRMIIYQEKSGLQSKTTFSRRRGRSWQSRCDTEHIPFTFFSSCTRAARDAGMWRSMLIAHLLPASPQALLKSVKRPSQLVYTETLNTRSQKDHFHAEFIHLFMHNVMSQYAGSTVLYSKCFPLLTHSPAHLIFPCIMQLWCCNVTEHIHIFFLSVLDYINLSYLQRLKQQNILALPDERGWSRKEKVRCSERERPPGYIYIWRTLSTCETTETPLLFHIQ